MSPNLKGLNISPKNNAKLQLRSHTDQLAQIDQKMDVLNKKRYNQMLKSYNNKNQNEDNQLAINGNKGNTSTGSKTEEPVKVGN